jgi:ADP-ribose pyrophosphatase
VIDFPAGLVGDEDGNDDPAETAKRELLEETGYACANVILLTSGPTSPGITSETVAFYAASGLEQRGAGGGVGGEDIAVHRIPRNAVADWLKRKNGEGVLIDVKVWAGLWWLS